MTESQQSQQWIDLASQRLGGKVVWVNDEFFAPKENLLKPAPAIFIEGKYTSRGKWMDGWETRRRRTPGFDWCIVRLGLPGIVHAAIVDTSFFKGNFPERCSLEACALAPSLSSAKERRLLTDDAAEWVELLPPSALQGDSQNRFAIVNPGRFTHVRFKIFPDGGVARLRILGEVVPVPQLLAANGKERNLAAIALGARVIQSSDEFFGAPLNLLMPDRAPNMSDGWETRRRRGPGHDWVILQLGGSGSIERVAIDTAHFKGNFPESCSLDGVRAKAGEIEGAAWKEVLPRTKLKANSLHIFEKELQDVGPVSHVRFHIYPDGGVSRLKIFGQPEGVTGLDRFNALSARGARKALLDCCGARKWAEKMAADRPFASVQGALDASERIWKALEHQDWLAAFRHHPPIGGKKAAQAQSAKAKSWSAGEQSGVNQASATELAELAKANADYAKRFGYIFIICASGKTTGEMLAAIQQRLSNDPQHELHIAADEQQKITKLRLERLLRG
ncbi:MAG: allantoicase [Candidatus Acidiferrales bacterium]